MLGLGNSQGPPKEAGLQARLLLGKEAMVLL